MKKLFVGSLFVVFLAIPLSSQEVYEVGVANVSIEPGNELVSLALGGYAAPWEGRFSLQWEEREKLPPFSALAAMKGKLYGISGTALLKKSIANHTEWEVAGKAGNVKHLAADGQWLWAITSDGKLLKANPDDADRNIRWKKSLSPGFPVKSFSAAVNQLYATDGDGSLWTAILTGSAIKWTKIEGQPLAGVLCLAVSGNRLIALTTEGELFYFGGSYHNNRWIKMAYRNGITFRAEMKTIVGTEKGILGVDNANLLYAGEHASKGDLSVRTISITSGGHTAVIVAVDVTGFNDSFLAQVKNELFKSRGIPASALFINASHTHFAPVAQNWPTWQESNRRADSLWLYGPVKQAILKAVTESLDQAKPAELFFGRGNATLGFNRSLRDRPDLYDDDVDVVRYQFLDGSGRGFLFLAACHPVRGNAGALHYTLSSNFPGVARVLVEEKTGTNHSLFIQGTAGDINPLDSTDAITGEKLAGEVLSVATLPMMKIRGPVSCFLDTVDFRVNLKSKEEIEAFAGLAKQNPNKMLSERNLTWCNLMLDLHKKGIKQVSMPVYVHTLNIGDWKLVGLSRETTTPYGLKIKELWPGKQISVAGYTNDVSSYLPTQLHIEKKNYEGLDSFYWYGLPDTFPANVEEVIITQIRNNNR